MLRRVQRYIQYLLVWANLSIEAFGSARIVSLAGERISEIGTIDAKAIVNAPRVPGIYFVQITTEDGRVETHKLIVK